MKIAFVNSCPYLGGAELWHLRTARALRERGHHVSMMLRPGPLAQKAREQGLAVTTLPMAFDLDLASFAKAYSIFRAERPDLILLNDQRECRVIAPAAALAGVKVRAQRKGWPYLKGSWRDRLVYRFFITHLIANSEEVAGVFRDRAGLDPKKIKVFHNGVDLKRFTNPDRNLRRAHLPLPRYNTLIGSVGRLVGQKGFDVLIRALGLLKDEDLAPRVTIAGEGEERERLEELAREVGVFDQLLLPGQVEDVPALLASLDLFVFPSRMEGRSNALAEAMAAWLPIIATDIPGNVEMIEHEKTGLLTPPDDPRALARAIKRLIREIELSARLGEAARGFAKENLDSEKIIGEIEEYMESLIKEAQA